MTNEQKTSTMETLRDSGVILCNAYMSYKEDEIDSRIAMDQQIAIAANFIYRTQTDFQEI